VTLSFSIDRSTFRTLVDDALRRIPTASRGNWTLHAPVDPGISLVELFAWLLEQRSFWADQVTAPLVRSVMALFGDAIRTARPAGTAITFAPELELDPSRAFQPHAQLSRRTPVRVPETDVVFTIHQSLLALACARYPTPPLAPIIKLAGDLDPTAEEDLRSGRPFDILASQGSASAELGIVLVAAPPTGATEPVSILFELDTSVQPEWSPEAVDAPPPATLAWEYKTTGGAWLALPNLRDGTGGLRRSGTLRFTLPADWSATVADASGQWIGWIRISTTAATFSSSPTVLAIVPNTALAYHYQWKCHGESPKWLPLPARAVQLDPGPLPLTERTVVFVTEVDGRNRWRVVPDFSQAGPTDRVVVVDRARATITFGDGLAGKLPRLAPSATPQVGVVYEVGGGTIGNVGPSAWEALSGPLSNALSYVPAIGGLDDETIDSARLRATGQLRIPTRAVNPEDHEVVAQDTPGVAIARAHAEVGFEIGECGVVPGVTTVFVVPEIHSRTRDDVRAGTAVVAPACDPGALVAVRAQFARTRLLGEIIFVASAAYRHVRLRATITGAPFDRDAVRTRIQASLRLFLDPLLGGTEGTGWTFGEAVRPTALLGVAQRELGDRGLVDSVAISIDGGPYEACDDVPIRPYELVAVDAIDVVIETASSQEAGLR
jgi:predicted phage baseplate assembly protein